MARRHWPDGDPLGARITVDDVATNPEWYTVIGVVEDARQSSLAEPTSEEMYFPYSADRAAPEDRPTLAGSLDPIYMTLVIRTVAEPAGLARSVESLVHAMTRDAPVSEIITMEHAIGEQLSQPRFHLVLLGVFAGIALLLAAVGVYGVISYSAARRTHEMGVRIALGAQRSDPFRRIVGQGMRLAALGGVIGIVLAFVATRFMRSLLFGVQASDPATFLVVSALLAVVALAACGLPAWRVARTDPVRALRSE
jgi:putative ABC transport system permease protein